MNHPSMSIDSEPRDSVLEVLTKSTLFWMNTDSKASWQAVQIDPDEYQGRWPALIKDKNVAEKLGVRDVHNYPRGLRTIDLGKISSDPFGLSIGDGEGARVLRSPFRRVWSDKSMSKICLCVVLHKMRHSVIE